MGEIAHKYQPNKINHYITTTILPVVGSWLTIIWPMGSAWLGEILGSSHSPWLITNVTPWVKLPININQTPLTTIHQRYSPPSSCWCFLRIFFGTLNPWGYLYYLVRVSTRVLQATLTNNQCDPMGEIAHKYQPNTINHYKSLLQSSQWLLVLG